MTTSVGSLRLLREHPEIIEWFERIEVAAGANAWIDLTIRKRNGQPDSVVVQCALKMDKGQKEGL
mgnify:FL=1